MKATQNHPGLPVLERAATNRKTRKNGDSHSPETPDLILFLHGLGCGKRNFTTAFSTPGFYPGFHLLAPDLPGHGAYSDCPSGHASMEKMAAYVVRLLSDRAYSGLHIIAHSMGCAVGLLAVAHYGLTPHSFMTVEGNLTHLDCGLLSRRVAGTPRDIFVAEKLCKLRDRAAQSAESGLRDFALCLQECQPEAFHHAACSLVDWSDGGDLLKFFQESDAYKVYLYGEHSGDPQTLALLHRHHIRTQELPGCGHFAPVEQPTLFHTLCTDLITESLNPRHENRNMPNVTR